MKSRHPPAKLANDLVESNWDISKGWRDEWDMEMPFSSMSILIQDPTNKVPGFDLPRHLWVKLNRVRTGHGRCADSFYKWGISPSSTCDCGDPKQTITHIVTQCPLRCYDGSIEEIHAADPDALQWLETLDIQI